MRLVSLILPLCLIASCEKHSPVTARVPIGARSVDLPVASYSEKLSAHDSGYIEAVINGDLTEIHHPNGFLDSTAAGQSFEEVLGSISRSVPYQGSIPPLLISATAPTKFDEIRLVIRSAAKNGISRILFLVRSETQATGVIRIGLPTMGESPPKIEPFFIQIDDKGQIFTGSGPSRIRMDDGSDDRDLEKLNNQLGLYAAAAKACGCEVAQCQIHVDPDASYQRMIDILSTIKKWGLRPYFTDMESESRPKQILSAPRKPTAPFHTKPLPLAPPSEHTDQGPTN